MVQVDRHRELGVQKGTYLYRAPHAPCLASWVERGRRADWCVEAACGRRPLRLRLGIVLRPGLRVRVRLCVEDGCVELKVWRGVKVCVMTEVQ